MVIDGQAPPIPLKHISAMLPDLFKGVLRALAHFLAQVEAGFGVPSATGLVDESLATSHEFVIYRLAMRVQHEGGSEEGRRGGHHGTTLALEAVEWLFITAVGHN